MKKLFLSVYFAYAMIALSVLGAGIGLHLLFTTQQAWQQGLALLLTSIHLHRIYIIYKQQKYDA